MKIDLSCGRLNVTIFESRLWLSRLIDELLEDAFEVCSLEFTWIDFAFVKNHINQKSEYLAAERKKCSCYSDWRNSRYKCKPYSY